MKYTSIIEKILCLCNIISSSWIKIAILGIILLLLFLLLIKKITKKTAITTIVLTYLSFLIVTIVSRFNSLNITLNTLIDNIFMNIYFPSITIYLLILLFIDIIFITSILNPKLSNIYKITNTICFSINSYLFIIILDIIGKNKIDIFDKLSLFGNNNLITMLELSISIFLIWIIATIAIYTINKLTEIITIHNFNKENDTKPLNLIEPVLEVESTNIVNDYEKEKITTFIPKETIDNNLNTAQVIEPVTNQLNINELIAPKQELKPITNNDTIMDKIIKNELPVIEEERNTYTLNDYRIFNNMLKDIKEFNQSNTITISKNLEYRLITKYSEKNYDLFKSMLKSYTN